MTTDGVRLRTRADGAASAPPLLLLNSLGTDLRMWDAQVAVWSRNRYVIRFDQRGQGESASPPGPYTIESFGRDAIDVLDAYGVAAASLCGLSLGGVVAQWVAAKCPARVDSVVLAGTAARVGTEDAWRARAGTVRTYGMNAVVPAVLERFFSPAYLRDGGAEVRATERTLRAADGEGYAASCEALAVADLRTLGATVRSPCLVIVGTDDAATPPADARELQRLLPRAEYVELQGTGHLANLERPQLFTALVSDFLTTTSEGQARA